MTKTKTNVKIPIKSNSYSVLLKNINQNQEQGSINNYITVQNQNKPRVKPEPYVNEYMEYLSQETIGQSNDD